jgi:hypothetical protein
MDPVAETSVETGDRASKRTPKMTAETTTAAPTWMGAVSRATMSIETRNGRAKADEGRARAKGFERQTKDLDQNSVG